jgi:hypothetical protein
MDIFEMRQAVHGAEEQLKNADRIAYNLATLLIGRLRRVDSYTLKMLKRELHQFNASAGRWKEQA